LAEALRTRRTRALEIEVDISPEVFNEVYLPYLEVRERYLHLYGGAGSGKSVFAAAKVLVRMLEEPGHRFLLVRKIARTIRKSMYALLKDLVSAWGLGGLFVFRDGELELECINGSSAVSCGLDDPEKIKSIAGITGIWIEEATELTETDFNQLDLRLRGKTRYYKQVLLSYNPIHALHWLRRRFHQSALETLEDGRGVRTGPRCVVLKTTYKDNRFIDDEYKEQLEALEAVDPVYYAIYALGDWATPRNIVYQWLPAAEPPARIIDRVYGLDFGYNVPTAVIEVTLGEDAEGRLALYLRELLYETKLTPSDLIERLKELIPDRRKARLYGDGADPGAIEEIYRAGFDIEAADKAPGSVMSGIGFMKGYPLRVLEESENVKRELNTYKFAEDKEGNVLDKPVKFNDHALDAARYAAYTHGAKYWANRKAVAMASKSKGESVSKRPRRSRITSGYND
jgi:phage terminase large subunit